MPLRWETLLEMLRRFDPSILDVFVQAAVLAGTHGMAEKFVALIASLRMDPATRKTLTDALAQPTTTTGEGFRRRAKALREHGYPITAKYFDLMAKEASASGEFVWGKHVQQLVTIVQLELDAVPLVYAKPDHAHYLKSAELFGKATTDRFPQALDDIEDAGNCLALGLHTACVFHLMRVMEHALRELARALSIPDPAKTCDRSWGAMLKTIGEAIAAQSKAEAWPRDRKDIFTGAHGLLVGVKDAWRNEYMHLEGKADEGDALRIYAAVCGFMGQLAKLPA